MVRFAGRYCAVLRQVGVRCEPHVRTVRKSRGEPVTGPSGFSGKVQPVSLFLELVLYRTGSFFFFLGVLLYTVYTVQ